MTQAIRHRGPPMNIQDLDEAALVAIARNAAGLVMIPGWIPEAAAFDAQGLGHSLSEESFQPRPS